MFSHSPYGWVSYLHRAATTYYLCCGQALEDLQGAGRIGLTHIPVLFQYQNQKHSLVSCFIHGTKVALTSKTQNLF